MKAKHLYVSDLDGTLLNQSGNLSLFANRKLKELLHAGVFFTIASARSLTTIRERLGDLPFQLPIIHMNGGWITDYYHKKEYAFSNIPYEEAHTLAKIFMSEQIVFLASGKNTQTGQAFCSVPLEDRRNKPIQDFINDRKHRRDPRLIEEDFLSHMEKTKPTISFTLVDHPTVNARVIKKIKAINLDYNLAIYPMGEGILNGQTYEWTTIQSRFATKGHGAVFVANQLGISPKNLVVFGDNVNDVSLFEMARQHDGEAILVRNGSSQLQDLATKIIGYHHEDSVIKHILRTEQLAT